MKKILSMIVFGLIVHSSHAQNSGAPSYEPAKITLKNGTVREVVLELTSPVSMQSTLVVFDPKLLASNASVPDNQKEKLSTSDVKAVWTKRRSYEVKKYADMSAASLSALGKLYFLEVVKPGKITLYKYYSAEKPEGELLIGKGDEKLKAVASTALAKYLEDAAPVKEKFKSGGYGNNPKNDNAMFNDNLSFIDKVVDDYNEFAANGRLLSDVEKADRRRLTRALIFDLFVNYELSQRNGNLAVVMDYVPSNEKNDLKRVEVKSNYGYEDETTNITYNEKGELQQIVYQRGDKQFVYDFIYSNGLPVNVNIGGKKKIDFVYSSDTLKSVVREQNGNFAEFDLKYAPDQRKADIKLFVVSKGKRQPSSSQYFVSWNDQSKLTDFNLDVYSLKGITYAANGSVASFIARDSEGREKTATWEYINDDKGGWTERKLEKYFAKRTVEYTAR